MKKLFIILLLIATPIANAKSVCEKFFEKNNIAFRHKTNMDKVLVEFSLTQSPNFDLKEKKSWDWENRYSGFTDWQKCNSGDMGEVKVEYRPWRDKDRRFGVYRDYFCNGKRIFTRDKESNPFSGATWYSFEWYDSNGNKWYTQDWKENRRTTGNYEWTSTECVQRLDGYYTDFQSTLYHQYNKTLDQNWAARIDKRKFYQKLKPKF